MAARQQVGTVEVAGSLDCSEIAVVQAG